MKCLCVLILLFTCSNQLLVAQTASDVLENGERIKKGERLFLKYFPEEKQLKYDITKTQGVDFTSYTDSTIFLIDKTGVNIFVRPLNPLKYKFSSETSYKADQIEVNASDALSSIIENIKQVLSDSIATSKNLAKNNHSIDSTLIQLVTNIEDSLKKDQKQKIANTFKSLRAIAFENYTETQEAYEKVNTTVGEIQVHFTALRDSIDLFSNFNNSVKIDLFPVINSLLQESLLKKVSDQESRLAKLQKSLKIVKEAITIAKRNEDLGNGWFIQLPEVTIKKMKIASTTFKVYSSDVTLSEKNEIVENESSLLMTKMFIIKEYKRFIPEIGSGIAYLNINYTLFGTETDSTGQLRVASAGTDELAKLTFNKIINYNLFIENSNIHPFWQIGAGANLKFPVLLTGFGIRVHSGSSKIALSSGLALTFLKELKTLNIGDSISGTAELESDQHYVLQPPKLYFGLQVKFN